MKIAIKECSSILERYIDTSLSNLYFPKKKKKKKHKILDEWENSVGFT